MNKSRKILFSLLVALALVYIGFFFSLPVISEQPFDPDAWQAAFGEHSSAVRLAMAEDLRRNYLLAQSTITQGEVIALLGPPESQGYHERYDLTYRLGVERSWLPTQKYLVIAFDHDDRIAMATILPRRVWD